MNSRQLMRAAMRRQPTERIGTMPQICHHTPVRIFADEDQTDWRDGMRHCAERPELIYEYVIRLVSRIGCDGLRLFVMRDMVKIVGEGNELIAVDDEGRRIGRLDLHGSGAVLLDNPPVPVGTLPEAKRRLREMLEEFTDEKMATLEVYRRQVDEMFVASSPGSVTMDTYCQLRGQTQAMIDLMERPAFVSAVMDMQAEVMIQRAERLLRTGIDALYIGDPSASASLISPEHFERFCLPAYQKFCQHFRSQDVLIYLHICGNSEPILEMMAATGVDAIEPLDPLGGVEVADAKRRVGDKVALMGGISVLTLAHGTSEQVKVEAIEKCCQGGPQGYILAAGDMVPPGTPLENLQTMVNVARHGLWRPGKPAVMLPKSIKD